MVRAGLMAMAQQRAGMDAELEAIAATMNAHAHSLESAALTSARPARPSRAWNPRRRGTVKATAAEDSRTLDALFDLNQFDYNGADLRIIHHLIDSAIIQHATWMTTHSGEKERMSANTCDLLTTCSPALTSPLLSAWRACNLVARGEAMRKVMGSKVTLLKGVALIMSYIGLLMIAATNRGEVADEVKREEARITMMKGITNDAHASVQVKDQLWDKLWDSPLADRRQALGQALGQVLGQALGQARGQAPGQALGSRTTWIARRGSTSSGTTNAATELGQLAWEAGCAHWNRDQDIAEEPLQPEMHHGASTSTILPESGHRDLTRACRIVLIAVTTNYKEMLRPQRPGHS